MPETMPLFPLGSVLFPGLLLPLHIFEERYRELVRELADRPEDGSRHFGVVAIRQGMEVGEDAVPQLYDVGCTAELRRVESYEDGRYDIVTVGGTRFRLAGAPDAASAPYLQGEAELLPEPLGDESEADVLRAGTAAAFAAYLEALAVARRSELQVPAVPDDPIVLSYLVAATVLVDLDGKQALLAEPDAVSRLRAELRLLRRETTLLRTFTAAPSPLLARVPFSPN